VVNVHIAGRKIDWGSPQLAGQAGPGFSLFHRSISDATG
jgi:hypothetical protein